MARLLLTARNSPYRSGGIPATIWVPRMCVAGFFLSIAAAGFWQLEPQPTFRWAGDPGGHTAVTIRLEEGNLYRVDAGAFVPTDPGTHYPISAELRSHATGEVAWRGSSNFVGTGYEGMDHQVLAEFQVNESGEYDMSWLFDSRLDASQVSLAVTEVAISRYAALALVFALVPGMLLSMDILAAHLNYAAARARKRREAESKELK